MTLWRVKGRLGGFHIRISVDKLGVTPEPFSRLQSDRSRNHKRLESLSLHHPTACSCSMKSRNEFESVNLFKLQHKSMQENLLLHSQLATHLPTRRCRKNQYLVLRAGDTEWEIWVDKGALSFVFTVSVNNATSLHAGGRPFGSCENQERCWDFIGLVEKR
jgi:hypothetical protein